MVIESSEMISAFSRKASVGLRDDVGPDGVRFGRVEHLCERRHPVTFNTPPSTTAARVSFEPSAAL